MKFLFTLHPCNIVIVDSVQLQCCSCPLNIAVDVAITLVRYITAIHVPVVTSAAQQLPIWSLLISELCWPIFWTALVTSRLGT